MGGGVSHDKRINAYKVLRDDYEKMKEEGKMTDEELFMYLEKEFTMLSRPEFGNNTNKRAKERKHFEGTGKKKPAKTSKSPKGGQNDTVSAGASEVPAATADVVDQAPGDTATGTSLVIANEDGGAVEIEGVEGVEEEGESEAEDELPSMAVQEQEEVIGVLGDIVKLPKTFTRYRSMFNRMTRHVSNLAQHKYVVGVNGESLAHKAFEVACALQKGMDHVAVLHVYDVNQQSTLPDKQRAEKIREKYDVELVTRVNHHSVTTVDIASAHVREATKSAVNSTVAAAVGDHRRPSATSSSTAAATAEARVNTKQALAYIVNHSFGDASFLITGMHSATGSAAEERTEKERGEAKREAFLGVVSDLTLRTVHCPSIIVKDTSRVPEFGQSKVFVVAINGKEASNTAYNLVHTMMKPKDEVVVLHIYEPDAQDELPESRRLQTLRTTYTKDIESRGVTGTFVEIVKEGGKPVAQHLCEYVHEHIPHFLVLAAQANKLLGSVTETVVKNSQCTIVVAKDEDEE